MLTGQVLARLGNSGHSDAPRETAVLPDLTGLDSGAPWRPAPDLRPVRRHDEFPRDNAIADFGPAAR